MHIANVKIGSEWEKLETLITAATGTSFNFEDDTNYYITNSGGYIINLIDTDQNPITDSGLPLSLKETCGYRKGTNDLQVRCHFGNGELHIEEEDQ